MLCNIFFPTLYVILTTVLCQVPGTYYFMWGREGPALLRSLFTAVVALKRDPGFTSVSAARKSDKDATKNFHRRAPHSKPPRTCTIYYTCSTRLTTLLWSSSGTSSSTGTSSSSRSGSPPVAICLLPATGLPPTANRQRCTAGCTQLD